MLAANQNNNALIKGGWREMLNMFRRVKKRRLQIPLFVLFGCLLILSSPAYAELEIGPIGYHWLVYDTGVSGTCIKNCSNDSDPDACIDDCYDVAEPWNHVTELPDTVLIGVRVCNTSADNGISDLSVTFSWDPNSECAPYPTDGNSGEYNNYYTSGDGSGMYCRADRFWLESMESDPTITKGYAAAFNYTETKNCDMGASSCEPWDLDADTSGEGYWDRYDEMEELGAAILPVPGHCKDVYFNVSGDTEALADLQGDGSDAGGSLPFQITATGTEENTNDVKEAVLTDVYFSGDLQNPGSPTRGDDPDQDPREGDYGAAVASYEVFPDERSPIDYHYSLPATAPQKGDTATYEFGWELNNFSSMFSTLDFPDDLYDVVSVTTEVWSNYSRYQAGNTLYRMYVSNRNGLDTVSIDDNWYDSYYYGDGLGLGTWGGWFNFGVGDPDGVGNEYCTWTNIVDWPATTVHSCNFTLDTAGLPERACYYQEQNCNVSAGRFVNSIYTVRAKRGLTANDTIKWAQSYTEEGGFTYMYWILVDEITYANVDGFRAYEGSKGTMVEWQTSSEDGTVGYYLYRLDPVKEKYKKVNKRMLPALPGGDGGVYTFADRSAKGGTEYTYKLVEVELGGERNVFGPYSVGVEQPGLEEALAQASVNSDFESGTSGSDFHQKLRKPSQKSEKLNKKARELRKFAKDQKKKRRDRTEAKLIVDTTGLYHLTNAELAEALGVSERQIKKMIKKNTLSLKNKGKNVQLLADKSGFDGVYFYGVAEDSNYTQENVYWLKKGKNKLLTINKAVEWPSAKLNVRSASSSFPASIHAEEDTIALTRFYKDPEANYWVWKYLVGGYEAYASAEFSVDLPNPTSEGEAELSMVLKGISGSHHANISLNGYFIGDVQFEGEEEVVVEVPFVPSLIVDGNNIVTVEAVMDSGVTDSMFCVNYFDISFERLYQAVDDKLFFKEADSKNVAISGFTTSEIFVIDITEPGSPRPVSAKVKADDGGYTVVVNSIRPGNSYLAVGASGFAALSDQYPDVASKLRSKRKSVDYLVIAPSELLDGAQKLADYRSTMGLRSLVVDLEDVMDEFNFGIYSPEAIRSFVEHIYTKRGKAPQYVVLVGNGTYDYKDIKGYGDNLTPMRLVGTDIGLTSSDSYYTDMVGDDGVPELAIGRIPVRTADELDSYIDKLIAMENTYGQSERSKVLAIADGSEGGDDFAADSDEMLMFMPDDLEVEKVYLTDMSLSEARTAALNSINNGLGFVNFIGHSGVNKLGRDGIISLSDMEELTNVPLSPVITLWGCVAGRFEMPGNRGISEELILDADGGASAVFASSIPAENVDSKRLGKYFYETLGDTNSQTIGSVVLKTKQKYKNNSTTGLELISGYNLFGDPAMTVK